MRLRRTLVIIAGALAFIFSVAYADLVLRAKAAYLEGEKYMAWDKDPTLKKAALDAELAVKEKDLRERSRRLGWSPEELEQRIFLARFERDERMKESSLKYAYVWYKTAVELFTPPESRWVALCRQKAPVAKELWKKELDAKKIPYKDYMLE